MYNKIIYIKVYSLAILDRQSTNQAVQSARTIKNIEMPQFSIHSLKSQKIDNTNSQISKNSTTIESKIKDHKIILHKS